jgi:hypothetical protein
MELEQQDYTHPTLDLEENTEALDNNQIYDMVYGEAYDQTILNQ